jgi:hypothetical protein
VKDKTPKTRRLVYWSGCSPCIYCSALFEPPFTEINDLGITGVFDEVMVGKIIRIIDEVNNNALKNMG